MGSVPLETLKARFMVGVSESMKEKREENFEKWLNQLESSHVITIDYGIVTFNAEQWGRVSNPRES